MMAWARALLQMTRPTQIALIVGIFVNGALLAVWAGQGTVGVIFDAWPAVGLLILVSASVHLANEAADHASDRLTRRTPFSGGSGALEASGLSPRLPLALSLALAAAALLGVIVALTWGVLPAVAALLLLLGLGGGLAYSLEPAVVEKRGWGEPLNALLGALFLPLLGVAAIAATLSGSDVVAFLPFFFVTLASVMATAWPDRVADAATGKATMQVRLQPVTLRRIALIALIGFIASTLLSVAIEAMPLAGLGLLVVPLLLVGLARYTREESPIANVAAMVGLGLLTLVALGVSLATEGRLI
jgi:1,4-dihydroxy-2-naphthoate octaprenyltransferase